MAQYVTPSSLSGLFKESYGDEVIDLLPEVAQLVKIIPFVQRDKELGNKYHQPVIVASEQGITYASADAGAFALEESVSMTMQDAQIQGAQMLLRSAISYDAAARASNSKKAFVKSTELLVENMLESLTKRLEISLLHGQKGIADLAIGGFVETSGGATTATFTVTPESWAAGIFCGAEGAKLVFYSDSSDTIGGGTNLNTNSDTNQNVSIVAVDVDARQVTVEGSAAAIEDINDISVSKAIRVYFKGSVQGSGASFAANEMAGMNKIITNSGTLFNINAATYNLWKGNTATVSGQLTMGKLLSALSKGIVRGLNEKVVCAVNPATWANLASDLAALRRFDGSYDKKKGESGVESLVYHGQNGEVEILSHNLVKAGECFIFPPKRAKRIGAQEISFKTPGREEEIFLHLPNNAGFELRVYSDQALFLEMPSRCVYVTGFTNA
jgi:hypothetical protein